MLSGYKSSPRSVQPDLVINSPLGGESFFPFHNNERSIFSIQDVDHNKRLPSFTTPDRHYRRGAAALPRAPISSYAFTVLLKCKRKMLYTRKTEMIVSFDCIRNFF